MAFTFPRSRVADPRTAPVLRWGFVGTGYAARLLAADLRAHTDQRLVACFSRGREAAAEFARTWECERVASSLDELLVADDIDAIFLATPHSDHHAQALAAIAAGKPVLIEKSFTQTAWQAEEVFAAAAAAQVTCMEAMWTRCLPRHDVLRQLLADGGLGEIETVTADHGQYFEPDANHRLYDPARAGGAMLDLGVYPVSFAHFVLGTPGRITGRGALAFTGVDRQVSGILDLYPASDGAPDQVSSAQAIVHCTLAASTPVRATIAGSIARAELNGFYGPGPITVLPRGGEPAVCEFTGWEARAGHSLQAAHFAELVTTGQTESPLITAAESIAVMRTMDQLRADVGCRLPGDKRS